jgi:hypothetical protein
MRLFRGTPHAPAAGKAGAIHFVSLLTETHAQFRSDYDFDKFRIPG